jgi:hypothetical protein
MVLNPVPSVNFIISPKINPVRKVSKKTPKRPSCIQIDLQIYPYYVLVFFGEDDEEVKNVLKEKLVNFESVDPDTYTLDNRSGTASFYRSSSYLFIRCKEYPDRPFYQGTLAHEIFHVVTFLANEIGLSLNDGSDEAYAYLIGYITREVYDQLNSKSVKK